MTEQILKLKSLQSEIRSMMGQCCALNIDRLVDIIYDQIVSENWINQNRRENIYLDQLIQTRDKQLSELLRNRNKPRLVFDHYTSCIKHLSTDITFGISQRERKGLDLT